MMQNILYANTIEELESEYNRLIKNDSIKFTYMIYIKENMSRYVLLELIYSQEIIILTITARYNQRSSRYNQRSSSKYSGDNTYEWVIGDKQNIG